MYHPARPCIMGLDPGLTTGVAVLYDDVNEFETFVVGNGDHKQLWHILGTYDPHTVVYERFDYRRQLNHADLTAVELIGVIKLWGSIFSHAKLVSQTQLKGKKGLWTDDKLKALRLYQPARPHQNDAMRQVLYYLTTELEDTTWLKRWKEAV